MKAKQILTRKNQKKLTEEELKWIVAEEIMAYLLAREAKKAKEMKS